ncbi:MAG: esterase, partial [Pseudomonadota bacterium]|nr:esterase [Pseudomonadota bacterium]
MAGQVQGTCDAKFAELKEEFERNFAERGESGASVCVSVNGETVVDLWGGV